MTKQSMRRLASQYAKGIRGIIYADDSSGNVWTTDSYSAIKAEIKPNTPNATIADARPKMDSILDGLKDFEAVTSEFEDDTSGFPQIHLNDKVTVNADYFYRLQGALPKAKVYLTNKYAYSPVVFKQDNEVMALLMPLRR